LKHAIGVHLRRKKKCLQSVAPRLIGVHPKLDAERTHSVVNLRNPAPLLRNSISNSTQERLGMNSALSSLSIRCPTSGRSSFNCIYDTCGSGLMLTIREINSGDVHLQANAIFGCLQLPRTTQEDMRTSTNRPADMKPDRVVRGSLSLDASSLSKAPQISTELPRTRVFIALKDCLPWVMSLPFRKYQRENPCVLERSAAYAI
jgi:hypothetical protein